jgi:hypothetical protein
MTDSRIDAVTWAAAIALDRLAGELGRTGRIAMAADPALVARVDQHAADVRDSLAVRGRVPLPALASYADGVRDVALARGVDPARVVTEGWAGAPWPSIRLLAVHLLADRP